ncbi:MAG: hypothetical protein HKN63_00610 [Rhodobacteraceae bacterium]|nr:hypothetical protein [Paracoccaceae bacterium]
MSKDYRDLLTEAETRLTAARQLLAAEITAYPTPISGCDAQFNHLLAERRRIALALEAISVDVFIPTPRTPTRTAGVESR